MSKVKRGCYIETKGLNDEVVREIEEVFTAKFGDIANKRRIFTRLFAGLDQYDKPYYNDLVFECEYEVTVEDVLGSIKEEEKEVSEFKAMKFRVENEEHSRQIQEALFELGYSWHGGVTSTQYTHNKFLFADANGGVRRSNNEGHFRTKDVPECYIEPVTKYEIKEVPVKKMTHAEIEEALGYKVEIKG